MSHEPVLRDESVALLRRGGPGLYVDATLGAGGHAAALLTALPEATLLGIDRDPAALALAAARLAPFGERVFFLHADFRNLPAALAERAPAGVAGLLVDLGVSSMQLDAAARGFAHRWDGPLDMRMDPTQGETAAALLARLDAGELRRLLGELGEVRRPGALARRLVAARELGALDSTADLRRVVERVAGAKVNAELSRVFQALRIAVNDELGALDTLLAALPDLLAPGGVAVAISYHSLEDRRVKTCFREESRGCICPPELPVCACGRQARLEVLTPRPIRPDDVEIARNPRARSARLRAARRRSSC